MYISDSTPGVNHILAFCWAFSGFQQIDAILWRNDTDAVVRFIPFVGEYVCFASFIFSASFCSWCYFGGPYASLHLRQNQMSFVCSRNKGNTWGCKWAHELAYRLSFVSCRGQPAELSLYMRVRRPTHLNDCISLGTIGLFCLESSGHNWKQILTV